MMHFSLRDWEMAGAAAGAAAIAGVVWWLMTRRRPSSDELERERRELLAGCGRIVDGILLDQFQVETDDGRTREMLLYHYDIGGVVYECSQDVTSLSEVVDPARVRVGMPCSVRYQPGSPENSILVAERWNGIRESIPAIWLLPPVAKQNQHALAG